MRWGRIFRKAWLFSFLSCSRFSLAAFLGCAGLWKELKERTIEASELKVLRDSGIKRQAVSGIHAYESYTIFRSEVGRICQTQSLALSADTDGRVGSVTKIFRFV